MTPTRRLAAAVCGALFFSAPAFAADVYLELGGVEGEAATASSRIDVQSWSWGASKAGAAAVSGVGGGTGKVNVQDLSAIKTPRDSASGLPTGKRTAASAGGTGTVTAEAAVAAPVVRDVSVAVPEAAAKSACATGKHIKSATITTRTERVELTDVVVTACSTAAGVSTLSMRGHQKTGHVTILK